MNRPRLSLVGVEDFEALMDKRRAFGADGVWTPEEERHPRRMSAACIRC